MPPRVPGPFRGMAPAAARRARPVQRSRFQGLRGNPDACHPRRGSACHDNNGAPAEAQRSGFGGERRHSGGNELCRLRRSERSVTCADEAGGNARPLSAVFAQPAAAMSPRIGGPGSKAPGAPSMKIHVKPPQNRRSPRPFFLPISSGRNGGARRVGGAGGASDRNPAKPPSKKRRVPRGEPPVIERRAESSRPTGQAVAGASGRMISAPTACPRRTGLLFTTP